MKEKEKRIRRNYLDLQRLATDLLKEQRGQDLTTGPYHISIDPTSLGGKSIVHDYANKSQMVITGKRRLMEKSVENVGIRKMGDIITLKKTHYSTSTRDLEIIYPIGEFTLQIKVSGVIQANIKQIQIHATRHSHNEVEAFHEVTITVMITYNDGGTAVAYSHINIQDVDAEKLFAGFHIGDEIDRSKYKRWQCYHMTDDDDKLLKNVCDECRCIM